LPSLPLSSVLLVDDDSTANFLHQLLLQKTLCVTERVFVAENGQQALTQLGPGAAFPPQLILLDLNMPVMNGWEFLAAYQQLPPMAPRPLVVLLSSSDHDLAQARAQQLPVDDFLSKPLTREKVQALLDQHFPTT
jgi:CheY-like chemotaxis protein